MISRQHSTDPEFLIFSGHNERAVIALCRFFSSNNIVFHILARDHTDRIFLTSYKENVIGIRSSREVSMDLFNISKNLISSNNRIIYCPTTEYINTFFLENYEELKNIRFDTFLCEIELYRLASNKSTSRVLFSDIPGISVPRLIDFKDARSPCVFKPNINVCGNSVNYPVIVKNNIDLFNCKNDLNQDEYYCEEFIYGESIYLCGSLSTSGRHVSFWQKNLAQQPNGKSIVVAREIRCPAAMLTRIERELILKLQSLRYFGFFMIELRLSENGAYFIEMNPRPWGPIQLGLDACPEIFSPFVNHFIPNFHNRLARLPDDACYTWMDGMADYVPLAPETEIDAILQHADKWDVYQRRDWNDVQRQN